MSAMPYEGKGYLQLVIDKNEGNNFQTFIKGFIFGGGLVVGCFMRSEGEREARNLGCHSNCTATEEGAKKKKAGN